jgi:uncharacterized protein (TIGR03545 family)
MFRWKGIIFLAVLAGIFFLLTIFFTDAWLERQLETLGTNAVGAKVEIDGFDFSFSGLHIRWERLQVANPKKTMKNIMETGRCEFNMEFWPLLSKKVIIENVQVSNLRSDTDRETDGKIIKPKKKVEEKPSKPGIVSKTMDKLQDEIAKAPAFQLKDISTKVNLDSIFKIFNFQTPGKADSLKKDLTNRYASWEKRINDLDFQKEYKDNEKKINAIDINKIKTIDDVKRTVDTVTEVKKSVDSNVKLIKDTKSGLTGDLKLVKGSVTQIDDWIKSDYDRARSLARLPDFNAQNIGKFIFGKKLVDQLNQYLGYATQARYYANKMKSDKPKVEKPPRFKGQNIYFYNKNARPDFWIKKIDLSGQTVSQIELTGLVTNIVSDQRFINKTTDIHLKGSKEGGISASLDAVFNYLEQEPSEKFDLTYAGFSMNNTKLSDTKFLPNKLKTGVGSVESGFDFIGDRFEGKIKFVAQKLSFDFKNEPKPKDKIDQIIRSIVESIKMIDVIAELKASPDGYKFTLNSNIDDLIVKKINQIIKDEIEKAKRQIQERVDKEVQKYKKQAQDLIAQKEKQLQAEVDKYEKEFQKLKKTVDDKKKEVEKKADQEKKKAEDKVKDELDKQLKKIF